MAARKKRITLAEISRQSGISIPTVSAILGRNGNNNSRFSDKTKEKVLEVATRLNYRPNRSARSLISKRHHTIAVLVQNLGYLHPATMQAILNECMLYGQQVVFETGNRMNPSELRILQEDYVDGVIAFQDLSDDVRASLGNLDIPTVEVNTNYRQQPATITFDEETGGLAAIRHLAENGYSRPLFIEFSDATHYSRDIRLETYRHACLRYFNQEPLFTEITRSKSCAGPDERRDASHFLATYLQKPRVFDSILCLDHLVPSVYQALENFGLSVPEDIGVVAINNTELNECLSPQVTSLGIDYEQLGIFSVQYLNSMLNSGDLADAATVPITLHARQSTNRQLCQLPDNQKDPIQ